MTLLTQSEAARLLGVSRQAVHLALKKGSLRPHDSVVAKFYHEVPVFTAEEVERYRVARTLNKGGRPRKASA